LAEPLLVLSGLSAGYGDALVLDGVSFELGERGNLAVLGRNGVGKTTLLLTIMGLTRLRQGTIRFQGRDISGAAPHRRALAGLGWVAQEREIFPSLSLDENLAVAARPGVWSEKRVYELFPRLAERRRNMGSQLSGGEQQMLAIGRALMTNPAVLLLDEPFEGLAPIIVEELSRAIRRMVAEEGMSLLLVEQNTALALDLTDEALFLERGRIAHRAPTAALRDDPAALDRLVGLRVTPA
jgi:branched-chain amino acid transport system ATP-binding protein